MNEKTISLLLVCLVALSIVYACNSNIALSSYTRPSVNAVPSGSPIATEENCQNEKLTYPGPHPDIMGDPVDDVRTH